MASKKTFTDLRIKKSCKQCSEIKEKQVKAFEICSLTTFIVGTLLCYRVSSCRVSRGQGDCNEELLLDAGELKEVLAEELPDNLDRLYCVSYWSLDVFRYVP